MNLGKIFGPGAVWRIPLAIAIAGTLDIAMAIVDTVRRGHAADDMLRSLASGPFPPAVDWGTAGAALGFAVHYAIIAVMAVIFFVVRNRIALVRKHTLIAAALYGVVLWLVMYGVVMQLRFDIPFPNDNPTALAKQLFAHVVLVGLSFGFVAKYRGG